MIKEYSTNEICKLCNVSRKQLCYYEEHGLLSNVLRRENNYRNYGENSVVEILTIKELRRLGFSIDEIRAMTQDSGVNSMCDIIKKRVVNAKAELEQSVARYEQCNERYAQLMNAINLLQRKNANNDPAWKDYEIINFPGQYVISHVFQGNFFDAGDHFESMAAMDGIIDEYDITILGSVINIYYDHFDSAACAFDNQVHDIEVCMTVAGLKRSCPSFRKLEPCRVLTTTHFGSFDNDLEKTYLDLLTWAREKEYKLSNTTIEEWLIGPLNTRHAENWVTKIMIPFAE